MLKRKIEPCDVEDIHLRLHGAAEIISAIYTAETEGPYAKGTFNDALHGAYMYMQILITNMKDLYDDGKEVPDP